jgi:hypothetical protein
MTLSEIRNRIWELAEEPSDLDPSTDTSYDGGPLLTWIANEGQRRVATWKDKTSGRMIRFFDLQDEFFFKTHIIEGTLTADGGTAEVTLPVGDTGTQNDRYNGWLVEINSETKMIVDYNGGSHLATVHSDWSTTPSSGDSYSLYKRFSYLLPSGHAWVTEHIQKPTHLGNALGGGGLVTILNIVDIEDNKKLSRGGRVEDFEGLVLNASDPTGWILKGNKLIFNYASDEEKWYKADYYRLPQAMSSDDDEPEVPEAFHYGIVLWGASFVFARSLENASKYATARDFESFMRSTQTDYDVMLDRTNSYGILRRD